MTPVLAKPLAVTAFDEWLDAFNRNDRAALTEFNARRFGEPEHNIEYLLRVTGSGSLSAYEVGALQR
ncbi:hypothetical protein [Luteimonas flava]|uniref:hypothetical protein n=1 Tax=Luteimonas flava TaxID=3115822 RepID=UPI002F966C1C